MQDKWKKVTDELPESECQYVCSVVFEDGIRENHSVWWEGGTRWDMTSFMHKGVVTHWLDIQEDIPWPLDTEKNRTSEVKEGE